MTHNFITCLGIWPCTVCLWHLRLTYFYNALPCLCAPSVNTDCHNVFAQDICQGTKWEHRMNTKQTCSLAFIVSGYQDQTDTFVCLSVWLYQSIMCWKFTGFRQCTTVCICLGELFWKFRSFFFFFFLLLFFFLLFFYFLFPLCLFFKIFCYIFLGKKKPKQDLSVFDGRSFGKLVSLSTGVNCGQLWLRGRASILLLDNHWFDSPGVHVEVSLGKILNPKLLLMCWLAPCMVATIITVCNTVSRFGQKCLPNVTVKCKLWSTQQLSFLVLFNIRYLQEIHLLLLQVTFYRFISLFFSCFSLLFFFFFYNLGACKCNADVFSSPEGNLSMLANSSHETIRNMGSVMFLSCVPRSCFVSLSLCLSDGCVQVCQSLGGANSCPASP